MSQQQMLGTIDTAEGSTMSRAVEAYLAIMAIGDIVRGQEVPQNELGRLEWDLAGQLGRLTGLSANKIRSHAVYIRMKARQEQAEAILRIRV